MTTGTDWQVHARWQLGELTNDQYADRLLASSAEEHDLAIQILRRPSGNESAQSVDHAEAVTL